MYTHTAQVRKLEYRNECTWKKTGSARKTDKHDEILVDNETSRSPAVATAHFFLIYKRSKMIRKQNL